MSHAAPWVGRLEVCHHGFYGSGKAHINLHLPPGEIHVLRNTSLAVALINAAALHSGETVCIKSNGIYGGLKRKANEKCLQVYQM